MSRTDKIARWNVLGLQGMLLCYFTEPIYLHSIIVGRLHHTGHLSRVMTHGTEDISQLPMSYWHNQPLLSGVSDVEVCQPGKSPLFSMNWIVGSTDLEIINATTGKRDGGGSSRLCKHVFSARWARLYGKLSTRIPSHGDTPSMYCEAKLGAHTYQSVKQLLFKAFHKAGLGTWVRKPPEQDQFRLSLDSLLFDQSETLEKAGQCVWRDVMVLISSLHSFSFGVPEVCKCSMFEEATKLELGICCFSDGCSPDCYQEH